MTIRRLLMKVALPLLLLAISPSLFSQTTTKTVTGTVKDKKDGSPLAGVSVTVRGGKNGVQTGTDGTFSITVPTSAKNLEVSFVGYGTETVDINGKTSVDVTLDAAASQLMNEVVVVGYGTARKRDLTGAVVSVQAKDFNKGIVASPDQLVQGVVAGMEVTNNSGQPGAATTIKIRGNNSIRSGNNPLYVIDGIPLDGRSVRPGLNVSGLGQTPEANPLLFINPADIASIEVLKDASSAAIFGSRGANGVILITTKKGQAGTTKLDVGASMGFSDMMKKPDILSAGQYRDALKKYGATTDSGASVNAFDAITRTPRIQNYTAALSGGNDAGRYRISLLASSQEGLIKKTGLDKYIASINGQYKFLDKKLSIDFNLIAGHTKELIAPISTNAGSTGNMISAAMNWNPTLPFIRSNGKYMVDPAGVFNPVALSNAYDDISDQSVFLGSIGAGYKILPELEYKFLYGINYGTGIRKGQVQGWFKGALVDPVAPGVGFVLNAELASQTFTHTLSYNKQVTKDFNINAVVGYEYWTTRYKGSSTRAQGFTFNTDETKLIGISYYDVMGAGNQSKLSTGAFNNPTTDLQSYFARGIFNWQDKYLITATFRADGSSRFGSQNRYAYFPSIAAAWNINNEDFMKNSSLFDALKLRIGYGETGNQEFVSGASQSLGYPSQGGITLDHFGNNSLKWETVASTDVGLDFQMLKGRLYGFIDVFAKKTKDPLFLATLPQPQTGASYYTNLKDGYITNKGFEVSVGAYIIQTKDFAWNLRVNAEYVKNQFVYPPIGNSPLFLTGAINGQGVSSTYAQAIANGQPVDVFYLRSFSGFDKDGIAITTTGSSYVADPNPHVIGGISTDLSYKKWTLAINTHGAFGHKIYNNTLTSVTNLGNIINGKNIAKSLIGTPEGLSNPVSASTRFLESGNYLKLGNATVRYTFGNIGKYVKNATVFVTGSNLFSITKYKGFDAEVNTDHNNNGVPSLGIDYIGYPTARTYLLGLSFSL